MNNYPVATVFGFSGNIGLYCGRILAKRNYRCLAPVRNSFTSGNLKTQFPPGALEFIPFDINNLDKVKDAIENSSYVINLIGILNESRREKFQSIHVDFPEVIFLSYEQTKHKDIAKLLNVDFWATIVVYKNNKEVAKEIGITSKSEIYSLIKKEI